MLSNPQKSTNSSAKGNGAAVVTAAVSEAADAGLAMFNKGGNAFDAALAAAFAETVWLPMKCGLAGDIVALYKRPGEPVRTLLAIGRGPLALTQGAVLAATGPCSIGGAGAPEGYARLAGYGDLPFQTLLEPAIRMAQDGVRWTPVAVRLTEESEALLRQWNGDIPYLPNGKLPEVGAGLHLPGLAKLLQAFGTEQGRLFHGKIGEEIVSHVNDLEGMLQRDDMIRAVATEMPCDRTVVNDTATLYTTPHPTHGVVHAQALKSTMGGLSETQALLQAQDAFGSGATGGTSVVTAADSKGNRVVLVHSNSFPRYGAGVVVPEYDLVLNNRPGRGFAQGVGPDHWNAPSPLSIPATTLNAWFLDTVGSEFWGGTPGGVNQAVWNLQATHALLQGHDPQAAIDAPKWGLSPSGDILWESDHAQRDGTQKSIEPHSHRSALQIIEILKATGAMRAGVDPRTNADSRFQLSQTDPQ